MPVIKVDKKSLEGPSKIPSGIHTVRFDGFEPENSKKGGSVNLNPVMKIINNPDLHDRRAYDNVNANAGWIIQDMCHAFGQTLAGTDEDLMPGSFEPADEQDPTKWRYSGPLLGQTGQIELAEVTGNNGKTYVNVKRYLCRVPGCQKRHSENLLK